MVDFQNFRFIFALTGNYNARLFADQAQKPASPSFGVAQDGPELVEGPKLGGMRASAGGPKVRSRGFHSQA
jgi:hypothetical protein